MNTLQMENAFEEKHKYCILFIHSIILLFYIETKSPFLSQNNQGKVSAMIS